MATELTMQLLKRFTPLDSLKRQNLDALVRKTEVAELPEGRVLAKAGDTDHRLLYLVSGTLLLTDADGNTETIQGGSPEAKRPIAESIPRKVTVQASSNIEFISIDADLLDVMLTWDQTGTYEVNDLGTIEEETGTEDWMTVLLQTKAMQQVPASNIQAIFMRMQQISLKAGETIIKQGDDGDFFYVITAGTCSVTRETPLNKDGIRLAELGVGDTFGEEALIAEAKRNATVRMLTDGSVMRLSKEDFQKLLNEPILDKVDYSEAKDIVQNGGKWLDVRLPSEFEGVHEEGALNIPLYFIRLKLNTLEPDTEYVVYCDTGRRSSAGAFILSENGFNAKVLNGGFRHKDES